jgi:hypothetical protein
LTVTLVSAVHLAPRVGDTGDGCGCSGRSASGSRASQGRAIAHGSATRSVAKSALSVAIARAHKRQAQQKFIEGPPTGGKHGWLLVPLLLTGQLVRQARVFDGKFEHTRSFAGPSLGICHPFEMLRPLSVARGPVTPDPGRTFTIGE